MKYVPRNLKVSISPGSTWIDIPFSSVAERHKDLLSLPSGLRLATVRLFEDDETETPRRRLLLNVYRLSSLYMTGWRAEIVTLCFTPRREAIHFNVLGVYTDTLHWDPVGGIQMPNAVFVESRRRGRRRFSVSGKEDDFYLFFDGGTTSVERRRIGTSFVEANRICYFRDESSPFQVDFDSAQICKDVSLFTDATVSTSLLGRKTTLVNASAFYHPYRMEYVMG